MLIFCAAMSFRKWKFTFCLIFFPQNFELPDEQDESYGRRFNLKNATNVVQVLSALVHFMDSHNMDDAVVVHRVINHIFEDFAKIS